MSCEHVDMLRAVRKFYELNHPNSLAFPALDAAIQALTPAPAGEAVADFHQRFQRAANVICDSYRAATGRQVLLSLAEVIAYDVLKAVDALTTPQPAPTPAPGEGFSAWWQSSEYAFHSAAAAKMARAGWDAYAQQHRAVDGAMVERGAWEMCKRQAETCNVNANDDWAVYSNQYLADARAILTAALGDKP